MDVPSPMYRYNSTLSALGVRRMSHVNIRSPVRLPSGPDTKQVKGPVVCKFQGGESRETPVGAVASAEFQTFSLTRSLRSLQRLSVPKLNLAGTSTSYCAT